jgi:hypothetical protein
MVLFLGFWLLALDMKGELKGARIIMGDGKKGGRGSAGNK